jgi:hypothetical protein
MNAMKELTQLLLSILSVIDQPQFQKQLGDLKSVFNGENSRCLAIIDSSSISLALSERISTLVDCNSVTDVCSDLRYLFFSNSEVDLA